MDSHLHDHDFHAWAAEQAALLRAGRFDRLDVANVAEEIEAMGRAEKRELESRLAVLLLHLLKWRHQPERRGRSWELSVIEQRRKLRRHLADNPSLKAHLGEAIENAHGDALIEVERETGLSSTVFPTVCPFSFAEMMDDGFWPD